MLEKDQPGKYAMSVSVRDKNIAGWRSGKFAPTSDDNVYVWSPEEYDREFGDMKGIDLPELVAERVIVYVRRIR
jgi:hypothetical protein